MPSYKKDNKWYCSFYYTDWKGNKKKKKKEGFATKREAQAFERNFIDKMNNTPTISFENLCYNYMGDCKVRLKPTTYYRKQRMLQTKILPFFANFKLNEITPSIVRKWQNEMLSQEYKPSYLLSLHRELSSIFNFAIKYYSLSQNPARQCGNMGSNRSTKIEFWTFDEFKNFIECVDDEEYRLIFELLFYSGMRKGELLALCLSDFDFTENTVDINKNYAEVGKKHYILPPKTTKSKRTVLLPRFLIHNVKQYISKQAYLSDSEQIFDKTFAMLRRNMIRYCKKSGTKCITIHSIRHSTASLLINQNFSPLLISERLGHESVETTLKIYSHLYPNKQEEVIQYLETLSI